MVLLLLSIAFDLLKVTCNDIHLRALYPGRINVLPASETPDYMDLIPFLQQVKILAVFSLPGDHDQ